MLTWAFDNLVLCTEITEFVLLIIKIQVAEKQIFSYKQMCCEFGLPHKPQSSHSDIHKDLIFFILPQEHFENKINQSAFPPS